MTRIGTSKAKEEVEEDEGGVREGMRRLRRDEEADKDEQV